MLRDAVEVRGGFVENHDSGVFEDDSGDGEAVLPAAEPVAALADDVPGLHPVDVVGDDLG